MTDAERERLAREAIESYNIAYRFPGHNTWGTNAPLTSYIASVPPEWTLAVLEVVKAARGARRLIDEEPVDAETLLAWMDNNLGGALAAYDRVTEEEK